MILTLQREAPDASRMFGKLTAADEHSTQRFACDTLEDIPRPVKIPGKTAIAAGRYEVIINYSNRFKRQMPLLLRVPNFEGVRIHAGNTEADTDGCILVGQDRGGNALTYSRAAYNALFSLLLAATKAGKVWIDIKEATE